MRRLVTAVVFAVGLAAPIVPLRSAQAPATATSHAQPVSQDQTPRAAAQAVPVRAVLDKYCVSCHNQKLNVAGLNLAGMDVEGVGTAADVWEKVARKFRTHEMPPPGRPRPDRHTYSAMASQHRDGAR